MDATEEYPAASFNLRYVWLISVVAAMGGLLFGYDWVVIGGAKPFFEPFYHLTRETLRGWANSCALLGCLAGAVLSGGLSDKFGRKRLLIAAALIFTGSSILTGWAPSFGSFVAFRILGGVAIGMASNLTPMYIAEVAPAHIRGRLVATNQLTIVIGILAAQIVNWLIARPVPDGATAEFIRQSWNGQFGWRWMFTAVAVPSLLFFVGSILIPESPRWLVKNGLSEKARAVLAKIGGSAYAEAEVKDIQSTLSRREIQRVRLQDLLEPKMTKILLVGVTLAALQQWSGINVIFNYAEEIFRAAGYDISTVLKNIAWTGSVNLLFTFVALGIVDRGGRRPLMLFGSAALAVIYLTLGFCYFSGVKGLPMLLLVLAAIGSYAMSLAPVVWVVISEIFPNRIRGAAMAVAVSSLWIACFLLTFSFPILNERLGSAGTFWLYAGICVAGFLFVKFKLPETRGKTLEQIERELVD
jgi:sugar porter (SP) family MFS transporter